MNGKKSARRAARIRSVFYLALIALSFLASPAAAQTARPVLVMNVTGPVTPAMLDYIERGIQEAQARNAEALVITLNTPGGAVTVTQSIVQAITASDVPVVVYVAPRGAYAASAGTLITLAAHVAAMAPSTSIGAASPVGSGGADLPETEKAKTTNILQAAVEGLAKRRGPKAVEWAGQAITQARAAASDEALSLGVIDFIASDVPDLLRQMDGFHVTVHDKDVTLHTQGAPVEPLPMTLLERFLSFITDATIAWILLIVGVNGILFELSSPGSYAPGIVGAICLLLAFYVIGALDVNYIGLLFIALAFVLFILDIKAPTHGLLTAGGILSLVLGALILFNSPVYSVSWLAIVSVSLVTGGFFAFVVAKAVAIQRRQPTTGAEALVGATAVARTDLSPQGAVFLKGERWEAEADDGPIEAGTKVRVKAVEGFRLRVTRETPPQSQPQ